MLRIGEFSKLSNLTIKAMRFYDKESEEDWLTEIQLPVE